MRIPLSPDSSSCPKQCHSRFGRGSFLTFFDPCQARQRGKDYDDGIPLPDPLRQSGIPLLVAGPLPPPGSVHVGIEPPSTGDDYASEDESEEEVEDRPMTREELEEKTVARVSGNVLFR